MFSVTEIAELLRRMTNRGDKKQSGSCRNASGLKFKKISVINLQKKRVKAAGSNIKNTCIYQTLIRSSGARYMPSPSWIW